VVIHTIQKFIFDFKNINYILFNEALYLTFFNIVLATYTIVLFQLKEKQFDGPKIHGLPII